MVRVTGDLVERLRQRLTDLEAIAGAAPDCLNREEWPFWVDVDDDGEHEAAKAWRDAFSPAVVLRTIQAHRRLLAGHEPHPEYSWACRKDNEFLPCETVKIVAAIYLPDIEP